MRFILKNGFRIPIYFSDLQEIQYVEYFAGFGNLNSEMKAARYRSARLDLKDHTPRHKKKSNYMDLNSASGYAFLCPQLK